MRRDGVHVRRAAMLVAGVLACGPLLAACGSSPASPHPDTAETVVARALQVSDDAVYLPVQSHGRWTLASPGSWLQPTISTTSSPWRWTVVGRCTVIDPALIPGLVAFMRAQIADTFAGAEATKVTATFEARVRQLEPAPCRRPDSGLVLGPPGPLRDRSTVTHLAVFGPTALAAVVVHATDWQGGVSNARAGGGRRVDWAEVPNVVDVTYSLARSHSRWRVVAITGRFAPGSGP
jgi:hypothetical protein